MVENKQDHMDLQELHIKALGALKKKEINLSIQIYHQILNYDPKDFIAICNLGLCYLTLQDYEKSLNFYNKALKIDSNNFLIFNSLGVVYFKLNQILRSQYYYLKAYKQNKNNLTILLNIANFYYENYKFRISKKYYLKYYSLEKKDIVFYRCISKVNRELGYYSETLVYLKKGIKLYAKDNLYLLFLYLNSFPKIHFNKYQSERLVKRFDLILDKIIKQKFINLSSDDIMNIFTSTTNFYLAYCGNIKNEITKKYFLLIENFSKKILTNYKYKKDKIKKNKIIKIAFISESFYDHTVTRLFWNFFTKLSKNFNVTIYHLGNNYDKYTDKLKNNCNHFFFNNDLRFVINHILNVNYDALLYPEIGMGLNIQFIASLRLANLQCMFWGHPITSGSAAIDYFISSQLMEKKDNQKYYNEKLVCLPGIGIDLDENIFVKSKKNSISNIKRRKIIILQSLFKILPKDYNLLFKILKNNEDIQFFFIKDSSEEINKIFFKQIKIKFDKFFISSKKIFEKHFFYIKRQNRNDFLINISSYDIALDTVNWSGGNTHIEALLHNLPVVTMPGNELRKRHTFAFLKKINLNELIASNEIALINIITKLIKDDLFYSMIRKKIKKNNTKLFQKGSVRFFENFIINSIEK